MNRECHEFEVNVGLRQGNALGQVLFIAVVELINRSIRTKNLLQKLCYADDPAVIVELEADLHEEQHTVLVEWTYLFSRHRLRVITKFVKSGVNRGDAEIRRSSITQAETELCVYI